MTNLTPAAAEGRPSAARSLAPRLSMMFLTLLALTLLPAGCDSLDDDGAINEVIEGTWAFKYSTDRPLDFELAYERVVFRHDATCAIEYDGGSLSGTYRAGDAVIRIDYDDGGETKQMLWLLRSFSKEQIVAEYTFDYDGGGDVTAVVTLDRID